MIQVGSTALLAQRVVVLASTALFAAHASPSVVDATAGRFNAKLPTGFTITLLALDAEDFDEDGATDEVVATLLELFTEDEEGATLLELLDDELPTLELPVPAIENFIQFKLIA